jgi:hypothetical protein
MQAHVVAENPADMRFVCSAGLLQSPTYGVSLQCHGTSDGLAASKCVERYVQRNQRLVRFTIYCRLVAAAGVVSSAGSRPHSVLLSRRNQAQADLTGNVGIENQVDLV